MSPQFTAPRRAFTLAAALLALHAGCAVPAAQPDSASAGSPAVIIPASATATPDLDALQVEFQAVAAHVSPAVVAISAATSPDDSPSAGRQQALNPDALGAFLSTTTRMVGAGFFISGDGYILTNDHVIDGAQQLWVTTDDKNVYPALVVGSDPRSDLAVLKIPATRCPAISLAAADRITRGQWSIAIGNPFGLGSDGSMCLSVGVVSATDRSLPRLSEKEDRSYYDMIQTTAQINPGSSGGPLLDLRGNLIGINTAVVMPAKFVNGIGFAIPITPTMLATVDRLRRGEPVDYAYLGVGTATATQQERGAAGIAAGLGVKVTKVYPDSPAAAGELRENDVITAINHQPIADSDAFTRIIGAQPLDRPVLIDIVRASCRQTIALVLRKRGLPAEPVTRDTQRLRWAGMVVSNRAAAPEDPEHPAPGVVIAAVEPDSAFARAGLHEGSIITAIAGQPVDNVIALQRLINDRPFEPGDVTSLSSSIPGAASEAVTSIDR
jgi:serine protease Do